MCWVQGKFKELCWDGKAKQYTQQGIYNIN